MPDENRDIPLEPNCGLCNHPAHCNQTCKECKCEVCHCPACLVKKELSSSENLLAQV